jgi:predicted nucleic acid-binding protein
MNIYLDSSAFLKQYVEEPGSADVREWVQNATWLASSQIARAEIAAAMAKSVRVGHLSKTDAWQALVDFRQDWPTYFQLKVSEALIARADELAWEMGLRGYDAVHLASAEHWQKTINEPVIVATFDRELWKAAQASGLRVLPEK